MQWLEFEQQALELAKLGRELILRDQVVFIGTLRRDGSPRISPVEPDIVKGHLYLGMMWRSLKALDLLRDPRCTLHFLIHDRFGSGGELKLHGRAVSITDVDVRKVYGEAIYGRLGWKPEEPGYHLFEIDIQSAGSFETGGDSRVARIWRAGDKLYRYRQTADGEKVPLPAI